MLLNYSNVKVNLTNNNVCVLCVVHINNRYPLTASCIDLLITKAVTAFIERLLAYVICTNIRV